MLPADCAYPQTAHLEGVICWLFGVACVFQTSPALPCVLVKWLLVYKRRSGGLCRFFWCWNRNSGDTGGLVAEDWATLEWEKLAYLSLIGLRPWFLDWVRCHVPALPSSGF
jgi:hypothetical protein